MCEGARAARGLGGAKGSLVNKAILVPGALAISAFIPWAITPLLVLGGTFFASGLREARAQVLPPTMPTHHKEHVALIQAVANHEGDLVAVEKRESRAPSAPTSCCPPRSS